LAVWLLTRPLAFSARETVATDTPAAEATSRMVAVFSADDGLGGLEIGMDEKLGSLLRKRFHHFVGS
jgi:hypothetical protein